MTEKKFHFVRQVVKYAALGMISSLASVATTLTLLGLLLVFSWIYLLTWLDKQQEDEDEEELTSSRLLLMQHEALVLHQLVLPEDITVNWSDIGGCEEVLRSIQEQVVYPLLYACTHDPDPLLLPPKGVLLYGPPGCGKTMIAKAMAKEVHANFLNVDLSTIKNKWVGETEKMAAAVFSAAFKIQPCIVFLDEVDSILGTRNDDDGGADLGLKAVFLQMWDGLATDPNAQVLVLAATNRLGAVDAAFLRRLPLQFEIALPSAAARLAILSIHLQDASLAEDVDLQLLVEKTDRFSGSDLQELCRYAATRRLVEYMNHVSTLDESPDSGSGEMPHNTGLRCLTMADFLLALHFHRLNTRSNSNFRQLYV